VVSFLRAADTLRKTVRPWNKISYKLTIGVFLVQLFCVDVGTGTRDVLLVDTGQQMENAVQLVLPSATVQVGAQIHDATRQGNSVLLLGDTMGGGPSTRALKDHLDAGFPAYAIPAAALSFSDDLNKVANWGVNLVSPDEVKTINADTVINLGDVSLAAFEKAFRHWDISFNPDVVAVAVLDHGTAPPGESQRRSRFAHLKPLLEANRGLDAFVFTPDDVPAHFTRMQAVVRSIGSGCQQVIMDTGAASVLGTSLDRSVARHSHRLSINLGNSHTTAFLLAGSEILGFFEHHTLALSLEHLDVLIRRLIDGELQIDEIWQDGGHGSYIKSKGQGPFVVATGPRRNLMLDSRLNPYFAEPFGNMMLTGCYGLVKATANRYPQWREEIESTLVIP
jgi:uncharacterized protein (DUF1786 family)